MGRKARERPARLGEKLLRIREGLGLSQSQMLRRVSAGDAGHRNFISDYENGIREPSLLQLLGYARAAGVSMDVLVDDKLDLPDYIPPVPEAEAVMKRERRARR